MSKQQTIFVDGLPLVDGHFSGVGQYVLGILKGFDELISEQIATGFTSTRVKVIIPYNSVNRFRHFNFKHIDYVLYPLPFRIMAGLWRRGKIMPLDLLYGKGIYIFSNFVSMPLVFSKSLLVIYDISFELYRQYSDEANARFLSDAVKKSISTTSKIITISENAKKEIVDFYKVSDDFVEVATPATDPHLFYRRSEKDIEKAKEKYGITGNYILALSNLEPRKNLGLLVEAYCNLPKSTRDSTALLLVGVSGWKTDKLFEDIMNKVKDGYNIIRPSHYVDDDDKPAILSGASVLVYPSHYEGFGMPPLEALACGTPVITSDNSSLPEVVDNAGVMLDSNDIKGFTEAIKQSLSTSTITTRAITEGPARASNFSWKESARVYLNAAKEIE
jgi:glycosyltransferase involved in cell wall biosynthesis